MYMSSRTQRMIVALSLFSASGCAQNQEPGEDRPEASPEEPSAQKPSNDEPDDSPNSTGLEDDSAEASTTGAEEDATESEPSPGPDTSNEEETSSKPEGTTETPEDGKIDCDQLKVTGSNIGEVPENLELVNAKGERVSLHAHCNDVLYLVAATAY